MKATSTAVINLLAAAQNASDALFLGGADKRKRAAGLNNVAQKLRRAARGIRLSHC